MLKSIRSKVKLHLISASEGDLKSVKNLIKNNIDINYQSKNFTALIIASKIGNIEVVKSLITAGADLDVIGDRGFTALMWASYSDHTAAIKASVLTPILIAKIFLDGLLLK